jgi:hypothetical protein
MMGLGGLSGDESEFVESIGKSQSAHVAGVSYTEIWRLIFYPWGNDHCNVEHPNDQAQMEYIILGKPYPTHPKSLRQTRDQVEEVDSDRQGKPSPSPQQCQIHAPLVFIVSPAIQDNKNRDGRDREDEQQLKRYQELIWEKYANQYSNQVQGEITERIDGQYPPPVACRT